MVEMVKYAATGRRKNAIARVNLVPGNGAIKINQRTFEVYFPRETDRIMILEPLKLVHTANKFDVMAKVNGGGLTGQAGAIRLAISRALSQMDGELKGVLRKNRCLTRDPRMKERKKPGQKGARKKFQWVKR